MSWFQLIQWCLNKKSRTTVVELNERVRLRPHSSPETRTKRQSTFRGTYIIQTIKNTNIFHAHDPRRVSALFLISIDPVRTLLFATICSLSEFTDVMLRAARSSSVDGSTKFCHPPSCTIMMDATIPGTPVSIHTDLFLPIMVHLHLH
jgi:hypothetical protein